MSTTNVFPQSASDAENKIGSYWNKPGGKIGTVLGLGILGAIGYYVFPILTTVVWNTINFAIALAVAFVLYLVLSNRKTWLTFIYLYNLFIKYTIGLIIEMDPFLIAEDYINDIKREREHLKDESVKLDGQKEALAQKIKDHESNKQKAFRRAEAAKKNAGPDMNMEIGNQGRQIARLDEAIAKLTPIEQNLEHIGKYLDKVYRNSKFMLDDMEADLSLKKDTYYAVTIGNNALKSAMKIFQGDAEKRLMMEQSMEYLGNDIATKLASMKKAISCTGEFMASIDLDNATFEAEGLKLLEDYNPDLFLSVNKETGEKVRTAPTVQKFDSASSYDDLIK